MNTPWSVISVRGMKIDHPIHLSPLRCSYLIWYDDPFNKKMFSLIALQTSPPVVQLKSSIISWLLSRCKLTKYLFYLQIYGIINSHKMEDESNKSVMDRSILWFRASPSMCHCQENYCNSHREFQIIEKNNQENRSECEGTVFCCLLILSHFTIGM